MLGVRKLWRLVHYAKAGIPYAETVVYWVFLELRTNLYISLEKELGF